MNTLICGSLAYDTIMVFEDKFKNHILPDKIHILNVSFLVPEMRREFGGTAGNIAYNMQLLGGKPLIMATVGDDFSNYAVRLGAQGLNATHIKTIAGSFTAQAFITTDLDGNQITAFHPGAMNESHTNSVKDAKGVNLAVIAPDGREGMFQHAQECHDAGIPFMFDPSQGLPMFSGDELMHFIEMADYLTINDYEAQLIEDKTGFSTATLALKVKALVVTLGSKGSAIYADGTKTPIGTVAGAVVGGVAGSTIGHGKGSTIAAVVGAVAGGLAGSAIEEGVTRKDGLEITVKLDSGGLVAVVQEADEQFHPGEKVRLLESGGTTRVSH